MTQKQKMQNNLCMGVFIFTIMMAFFIGTIALSGVIYLFENNLIVFPLILISVLGGGGLWLWLMDWLLDNLPFIDDPNRFDPSREAGD